MAAFFKTATVNASLVAATLTDYPTYIDLSRIGITTLTEAQSVRVYLDAAKTTEVAREIVSAAECWAKIPSITTTTQIWVDADGVSADYAVTDTYGRNAVWSNGYGARYHLENVNDSTVNAYTLTNANTVSFNSQYIENGADTGSGNTNKTLYRDNANPVGVSYTQFASAWSIGGFFNVYDVSGFEQFWGLQVQNVSPARRRNISLARDGARLRVTVFDGAGSNYDTGDDVSISTWYHLVMTFGSNTIKLYLNGTEIFTQARTMSFFANSGAGGFGIFAERQAGGSNNFLSARADEFYTNTNTLSANWITTEYNNQSNESSFWGTWTDAGGGGGGSPTPLLSLMGVGT